MGLTIRKLTFACLLIAAAATFVHASPPKRITNGLQTSLEEVPYLASLRLVVGDDLYHFCGGSIISVRHILTAAHCLVGKSANEINVVVGTDHQKYYGQAYAVKKIDIHRNYKGAPDDYYYRYDIGIVTLNNNLRPSNWEIIKLASRDYPAGTDVLAAGWGDPYYGAERGTEKLLHFHTKLADSSVCARTDNVLTNYHLCLLPVNGQGICQGDSGGPLVANNEVIGISSFARDCGKYPSVFAKVRAFQDFIERVTKIKM